MDDNNKGRNIAISLLILALFLGGTIEISEGSKFIGMIYLLVALIAITRIKIGGSAKVKKIKQPYLLIGLGIVISDILFNLAGDSNLGTLDIMTFLFGSSLIALSIDNNELRRMGKFTAYLSATFIISYLIFFTLFNILNINFTHVFDHYFILIPVVYILGIINIPVEIIDVETIRIQGVEEITVVIGGPCSGLYSMFLLMGIIIGYAKMEELDKRNIVAMLLITIIVAYISNLFRVTTLYLTGFYYGSDAMMFVHTHLGWLIFAVVAGILIYLLNKLVHRQN
ncbi:Transmembrane exosortase [Candidatus Methanomarinus sp.]|nr:Transmembrane exosortase [ANME-2 cluster archaeon]